MGKASKKKEQTTMEKLTQGYEKLIKGKELNEEAMEQFEKTLKKATTKNKSTKK